MGGGEIIFMLLNIILGSLAVAAALGIALMTKSALARSWLLIGISSLFFIIREISLLLNSLQIVQTHMIKDMSSFLFILFLTVSVLYQYKIIRDISRKIS